MVRTWLATSTALVAAVALSFSVTEAGYHHIFIGEVMAIDTADDMEPLVFHGGRYRKVYADE